MQTSSWRLLFLHFIDQFLVDIDQFHNFIGHSQELIGHFHNFIDHFPNVIVILGPLDHLNTEELFRFCVKLRAYEIWRKRHVFYCESKRSSLRLCRGFDT